MSAANLPTYGLNGTVVTARDAELNVSGQFAGGGNEAGSCAPGIGINTGAVDPKLDDWSVNDQQAAPRTPQNTQHIGGDGSTAGDQGLAATHPVNAVQGADINDTLSYIVAQSVAAPGAGFGAASGDPVNRTGQTIQIGDRAWGTNTVP